MARSILANSAPDLNLYPWQSALFLDILTAGNQMAETLIKFDAIVGFPEERMQWVCRWGDLMARLVIMDLGDAGL